MGCKAGVDDHALLKYAALVDILAALLNID